MSSFPLLPLRFMLNNGLNPITFLFFFFLLPEFEYLNFFDDFYQLFFSTASYANFVLLNLISWPDKLAILLFVTDDMDVG